MLGVREDLKFVVIRGRKPFRTIAKKRARRRLSQPD